MNQKYDGRGLAENEVDKLEREDNYNNDKALKNAINLVKITAIWTAATAIPLLYLLILRANWDDQAARNEWLQKGLVAVVAFALGKVNLTFGDNKEE